MCCERPPPDLPSLLLRERIIIYLGLPLFSDDQVKQQLGLDVTELIIAQLLQGEEGRVWEDAWYQGLRGGPAHQRMARWPGTSP